MTTLYDEYMAEQYAEEQRRQRLFNPDRGLYSEFDHKNVVITFQNGDMATGTFWKKYQQDSYTVVVNGHSIHCTVKDIKSIRGA